MENKSPGHSGRLGVVGEDEEGSRKNPRVLVWASLV